MTTKTKVNPDYSASAERLSNPPEVVDIYIHLRTLQADLEKVENEIQKGIPETLKVTVASLSLQIAETDKELRAAIETFGGYQWIERGEYALRQRREAIIYKPELVRENASAKVAEFVIIQAVDTKALEALHKAGQIDEETLRKCGEIKTTYAFIIK